MVPVPQKLRLTISGLRKLGLVISQVIGVAFSGPQTTIDCQFELSRSYAERIYRFDLSNEGLYRAVCGTVLSRYIGLIEVVGPHGPVLDFVVDTTERNAESAVLACIKRSGFSNTHINLLEEIAELLGVVAIS